MTATDGPTVGDLLAAHRQVDPAALAGARADLARDVSIGLTREILIEAIEALTEAREYRAPRDVDVWFHVPAEHPAAAAIWPDEPDAIALGMPARGPVEMRFSMDMSTWARATRDEMRAVVARALAPVREWP
jgi:hypothetical protein